MREVGLQEIQLWPPLSFSWLRELRGFIALGSSPFILGTLLEWIKQNDAVGDKLVESGFVLVWFAESSPLPSFRSL